MPQVRDDDAAADHQPDVERIVQLLVLEALGDAAVEVVVDAVVAAQHERRDEPDQLLGAPRQRAVAIAVGVEVEEALDAEVVGAEHPRLADIHILVVDDSKANGDALRDLLEFEGAAVTVESQPAHAIEIAGKQHFDLIISDIAMPEIDGYAMLKSIRASSVNQRTPAIAYSGYSGAGEIDRARAAGYDRHLTKPIDVETLLVAITETANGRRAAD